MSWRISSVPAMSLAEITSTNATAWMILMSSEEDGAINAGYAVWRELIAELIASEKDDNCAVVSRLKTRRTSCATT